ncbi:MULTISPECIES: hypothetical protein [Pantoea]|jgi:hypothetical protein|uniref:hypothetical protein n=1 Tax=Pantoea TaxID=53335 RepID=UPI000A72412E|nr:MULTISPECIES: hypothetical protein [Pantoea]MBZ6397916.1 hypothetical protein [Pantoea sp.]MBZ6440966.1 hypothetical protein [Pantoea sp.]MDU7865758.1 hypothetical protein [Pantoea sp.]
MDGGISVWVPVISVLAGSVLTGTIQYFMNRQNHFFALKREEKAAADRLRNEKQAEENKLQRERIFITAELVFLLEQYAEGCARVAADHGDDNPQSEREPTVNYPLLNLTDVSGDWRVLSRLLMYRIRELPVLQNEAQRTIAGVGEYDHPPYYSYYFRERQHQFSRLGMKAVILAMRLRKAVGLPESRLQDTEWSAYNVLWKVWRQERKRRAADYTNK